MTVTEVDASNLVVLEAPKAVVEVIRDAVRSLSG